MWDNTRYDEQTKAELHLRLDVSPDFTSLCKYGLAWFCGNLHLHRLQELCERLWDISETRKEHGDRERDALMHGGRLEDQAAVLVNHHAILMQVAVVLCVTAGINPRQASRVAFSVHFVTLLNEAV